MCHLKQQKREQAAQTLLAVIRQLSNDSYIQDAFTSNLGREVTGKMEQVKSELSEQGYTPSSTTQLSIQLAINLVQPSHDQPLPYLSLLTLTKHLVDTVAALHASSSDCPPQNRFLPTKLLVHIYEHVCNYSKPSSRPFVEEEVEEDPAATQQTLRSLSEVSHAWRRIVLPRCLARVYIGSHSKLGAWCRSKMRYMSEIKWLHIDLSNSDLSDVDISRILTYIAKWACRMQVTLNFDVDTGWHPASLEAFCWKLTDYGELFTTLRLSVHTADDLIHSYQLLNKRGNHLEDCELYLGDEKHPILAARSIRSEVEWPEGLNRTPWTNYRCLVVPWHIVTITDFLRCTESHRAPRHRLRHLEVSLEVHQIGSPTSIYQIKAFFKRISPNLARLAIRIRLPITRSHLDPQRLKAFSRSFVDGLLACSKLRRVEVGGLGFSPELFTYLSELSVETLILLPNTAEFDDSHLLNFLSPTLPLSATLKHLQLYREPSRKVIRRYQASRVKLQVVDRRKEEVVLEEATKEAGIGRYAWP